MKINDAAYLAGLIDGEGCISVMRLVRANRPSPLFMARIQVVMTAKNLVHWIKRTTKEGTVNKKTRQKKHHKKQWQWIVHSQKAVTIIRYILPFLKLKKRQAQNLLAFQSKVRNFGGPSLSNAEIRMRTKYYNISRKLNGGKSRGKL